MSGRSWERSIAQENQLLWSQRRAMVARVPTHYVSGPARDPKVDFVGVLSGGRMVALEAKSGSGTLTRVQREYLAAVAELGGLAIVYRSVDGQRHVCPVGADGVMARRSESTRCREATWLDHVEATGE